MKDSPSHPRTPGFGCLTLFALPFALIGTWMAGLVLVSLWSVGEMREWREVPATIVAVELRHEDNSREVLAAYRYTFAGTEYTGNRVGLHCGADNLGRWHERLFQELTHHRDSSRPRPVWVDPDDPTRAVLDRTLRWERVGAYLLFALVFGGAGYGLIAAGIAGRRHWRRQQELILQHPGQPWRHREDWAAGEARSAARPTMILSLVFAAFWNLISLPVLFILPGEVMKGNRLVLVGFLFPAVGIGLLVWAVRSAIRLRRFGRSILALETLPGVIGGPLAGTIHLGAMLRPERGFQATLEGVRLRRSGSGKGRNSVETILHQETLTVPLGGTGVGPAGTTVPLRFAVPFEAAPTDDADPGNRVLWRVRVTADIPGVDYSTTYEVPVFRTESSSPDYKPPRQEAASPEIAALELAAAGVRVEERGDGVTIRFGMARHKGAALGLTLFFFLWNGAIALQVVKEAPIVFPIVSGLVDLLIVAGLVDLWLVAVRIDAGQGELRRKGGLFGLGRRRAWPAGEIERLEPRRGMQAGRKLYYDLYLVPRRGRGKSLARHLASRAQAEALAGRISAALNG